MKIAYFDCFSGISGDMAIGAFLDAGLSFDALSAELGKLRIKGYELKKSRVRRGAIVGTKFDCIVRRTGHGHRSVREILALIDRSGLSARAKATAKKIFENIGAAEARVHGIKAGASVYLHELADIDSIVDIAGIAVAIDKLGIDEVRCSPVTMGRYVVKTAHGNLPIPGPAALELLRDVPVTISNIDAELVTPTGAGIAKTLSKGFGAMPQMSVSSIGYGAGSRDLPGMPNMLRVIIGQAVAPFLSDRVYVVETNIDDMSPQHVEYIYEKLFREGALDVYTTSIQMKKTRPAFKLTAICAEADLEKISSAMFRETTTIGVRFYEAGRFKLARNTVRARTRYGTVDVKVASGPGGIFKMAPEYDHCVKAARQSDVPLRVVCDEAVRAVKRAEK